MVPALAWAQIDPSPPIAIPELNLTLGGGDGNFVDALKVMGVLTVLSLAPAIIISVTSFTRIVIVFSFLRTALGTQGSPPNQVLISLALFLTAAVMTPTATQVWDKGVTPTSQDKSMIPNSWAITVDGGSTFSLGPYSPKGTDYRF